MTTIEARPPARLAGDVAGPASEWLDALIRVTALVVLAEAVLLRGATRVFIHIPGLDVTNGVLGRVTDLARLAFRMAVPLTFALLLMLTASQWASRSGQVSAVVVSAFLLATAGGRFEALRPAADLIVLSLVAAVAVVAVVGLETHSKVPIAAWSAAFLMIALAQLLDQWAADGAGSISLPWLGGLAEAVALVAFFTAPLVLRNHPLPLDWMVGASAAGLLALALLSTEGQAAVKILLLWNLGWSGGYHVIVYAVAIGSFVMAITALVRRRRITTAASLIFMGVAGFGLFSSYQTALLVTGLALMSTPSESVKSRPRHLKEKTDRKSPRPSGGLCKPVHGPQNPGVPGPERGVKEISLFFAALGSWIRKFFKRLSGRKELPAIFASPSRGSFRWL